MLIAPEMYVFNADNKVSKITNFITMSESKYYNVDIDLFVIESSADVKALSLKKRKCSLNSRTFLRRRHPLLSCASGSASLQLSPAARSSASTVLPCEHRPATSPAPVRLPLVDSTCQVNQVPFPCISICNMNMVSVRETANIAELLKKHNRTEKEIGKFLEDLPKLKHNITPYAHNATDIMNILKGYFYTMDTIMEEVIQKCENLLLYCEFNRKAKQCTDIFTLIKTGEGHCCAFNYAALNDASELSLLPHDDTLEYYDGDEESDHVSGTIIATSESGSSLLPHDDTLEYYDGDEESDHVSGTIIATSESGRTSGLTVVFNVEPDDYPGWSRAINYGALIIINDPNDFPETSARDTYVTLGTSVDIKVEPTVYQSEADVRRVSPAHRACWFHDEVELEHTDRYSYETCVTECVMANFIAECGCTPYKYPRGYHLSYFYIQHMADTVLDETCVTERDLRHRVMANFIAECGCTPYKYPRSYHLSSFYIQHTADTVLDETCVIVWELKINGKRIPCDPPCYVECRDKGYAISKNTLPFYASEHRKLNTKSVNVDHLASIKVYFGKSSCSCYKLSLLMDANYFIATYGGVLGLSFGASLVTAAEVVYLLVIMISEKIYLIRKSGKLGRLAKVSPKRT
ncbi:amiloride-sensitive sodium channel subunit gamma-like [Cydia strobilella]|uniref:amiloride-sensitive sodium channel subunit gamma-like n=1 Tax=Cydia strobilella TaxID=1100964 RepID=UPI003006751F